jgi:hypothetical protein
MSVGGALSQSEANLLQPLSDLLVEQPELRHRLRQLEHLIVGHRRIEPPHLGQQLVDERAESPLAYPRHWIVGFHTQRTRDGRTRHRPAVEVSPEESHAGSLATAAGLPVIVSRQLLPDHLVEAPELGHVGTISSRSLRIVTAEE